MIFDLDADGTLDVVGWTARDAEIAFLARDRNGNHRVDDGSELFGTATPLDTGGRAPNGFEALRELDENVDDRIDGSDPVWSHLLLWVDRNHNGLADANEMLTIGESSIRSIDLSYKSSRRSDPHGNVFRYRSAVTVLDGGRERTRPIHDVFSVKR